MKNLNVASGRYPLSGFINLDNSPFLRLLPAYPFIRPLLKEGHRKIMDEYKIVKSQNDLRPHNCTKKLPFSEGSIDHILCSHFLEHVHASKALEIVKDFHRVLKIGGTLHLIVPDIKAMVAEYNNDGDANAFLRATDLCNIHPPSLNYRTLEFLGHTGMQHRWMYDEQSLTNLLIECSFTLKEKNDSPSAHFRAGEDGAVNLLAVKIE